MKDDHAAVQSMWACEYCKLGMPESPLLVKTHMVKCTTYTQVEMLLPTVMSKF